MTPAAVQLYNAAPLVHVTGPNKAVAVDPNCCCIAPIEDACGHFQYNSTGYFWIQSMKITASGFGGISYLGGNFALCNGIHILGLSCQGLECDSGFYQCGTGLGGAKYQCCRWQIPLESPPGTPNMYISCGVNIRDNGATNQDLCWEVQFLDVTNGPAGSNSTIGAYYQSGLITRTNVIAGSPFTCNKGAGVVYGQFPLVGVSGPPSVLMELTGHL